MMSDIKKKTLSDTGPDLPPDALGRAQSDDAHMQQENDRASKLEVARQFLEDEDVKTAAREKKIEFLKAKDIDNGDIQKLLDSLEQPPENKTPSEIRQNQNEKSAEVAHISSSPKAAGESSTKVLARDDRPPVMTYPEFLTKPPGPPPLVTTTRLLNALCVFAGASTILYGGSKYIIAPMIDSLTHARAEFHSLASKKLESIVGKLEQTVSVVPPEAIASISVSGDLSDVEDPSEMFHRDIGTQTSFPSNLSSLTNPTVELESHRQIDRLAKVVKSLSEINNDFRGQSNSLQDVKTLLDVFRDDLDGMTYGNNGDFVGGFDMHGKLKRTEPEDEIRKVRDNIRRIKGILLSTRNFPVIAR